MLNQRRSKVNESTNGMFIVVKLVKSCYLVVHVASKLVILYARLPPPCSSMRDKMNVMA